MAHRILTLPYLDSEESNLLRHTSCYGVLSITLRQLADLVESATMTEAQRNELRTGLCHLEGHIYTEVRELIEARDARKN